MTARIPNELIAAVYDPETGYAYNPFSGEVWSVIKIKTWKECESRDYRAEASAFSTIYGRKQITHIIWYIMTGKWPKSKHVIDHKDGHVPNTKWNNMRECTMRQNSLNKRSNGRTIGPEDLARGVQIKGNKYTVRFMDHGVNKYYGMFETKEEANTFAIAKRKELHGEFYREED